jgi:hypothetical protein
VQVFATHSLREGLDTALVNFDEDTRIEKRL